MEMTWADKLEAKGIEIGRREEREAGLRTLRQVLIRLLEQRFGPLGEVVTRRVEEISSMSRLGRMAEQVLVAQSLEEMGLG
ncbi:MAG TPA: hypothetical protein VOA87_12380 [Thermoanaerobaculia bacterium]|nr:hypothetical protein [Thermoanaerobaculia bacterium]